VAAAATALALGAGDPAPRRPAEVRSLTPSTTGPPATVTASDGGRRGPTATTPAPRPAGPGQIKAKGHNKPKGSDAGGDQAAATVPGTDAGAATTTVPAVDTATTLPDASPPPTDPPTTDPPAPEPTTPTTVAAAGGQPG
jgi:hypothetical protein